MDYLSLEGIFRYTCTALPWELTIVNKFMLAEAWEPLALFYLGVIIGKHSYLDSITVELPDCRLSPL